MEKFFLIIAFHWKSSNSVLQYPTVNIQRSYLMKKSIAPILLAVLLLILEALPLGAALHIANADNNHSVVFRSFFNTQPLVDGNFAPFIVAVLSVLLFVMCVIYYFRPAKLLKKVIFFVACAAMLLSFCPLLYCMQCYSITASAIAIILFVYTLMFAEKVK